MKSMKNRIILISLLLIFIHEIKAQKENIAIFAIEIKNERYQIHQEYVCDAILSALVKCDRRFIVKNIREWMKNSVVISEIPTLEQEIRNLIASTFGNDYKTEELKKKLKIKYALLSSLEYRGGLRQFQLKVDIINIESYSLDFSEFIDIPEEDISDRKFLSTLIQQKLADRNFCNVENSFEVYPFRKIKSVMILILIWGQVLFSMFSQK
jgi:hypothetical protein